MRRFYCVAALLLSLLAIGCTRRDRPREEHIRITVEQPAPAKTEVAATQPAAGAARPRAARPVPARKSSTSRNAVRRGR